MASSKIIATILLVVAMAAAASAATYTVGDSTGWTIPSNTNFYDTWAASKTFRINDNLVFNFPTGAHTAVRVSETEYKACTFANPIETYATGPATVTLNGTGAHYYLCSIPGHCAAGQKVTINVVSVASSPPPSTPPSKAPPSPVARPPLPVATPPASPSPSPSPVARPPIPVTTPPASSAPPPLAMPPSSLATSPSSPPSSLASPPPPGSPLPPNGTPSSPTARTPGAVSTPSSPPPASAASFSKGFKWTTFLALVLAFTCVW